jgi:hypothetical protein
MNKSEIKISLNPNKNIPETVSLKIKMKIKNKQTIKHSTINYIKHTLPPTQK